jgi:phage tail-like protein
MAWQLDKAMPMKYKFSDLNARNSEIGIEELHLVHEGLWSVTATVHRSYDRMSADAQHPQPSPRPL